MKPTPKYISRLLSTCLFLFFCSNARCQDTIFINYGLFHNYQTDTLLLNSPYENPVLVGSTVLPNTKNQQEALSAGFTLKNVRVSKREELSYDGYFDPYIEKVAVSDSLITATVLFHANCCSSFLFDLAAENGSLILIYHDYAPEVCACSNVIQLVFVIPVDKSGYPQHTGTQKNTINGINSVQLDGRIKSRIYFP